MAKCGDPIQKRGGRRGGLKSAAVQQPFWAGHLRASKPLEGGSGASVRKTDREREREILAQAASGSSPEPKRESGRGENPAAP